MWMWCKVVVWCGVVWCGVVWCGVRLCEVTRCMHGAVKGCVGRCVVCRAMWWVRLCDVVSCGIKVVSCGVIYCVNGMVNTYVIITLFV